MRDRARRARRNSVKRKAIVTLRKMKKYRSLADARVLDLQIGKPPPTFARAPGRERAERAQWGGRTVMGFGGRSTSPGRTVEIDRGSSPGRPLDPRWRCISPPPIAFHMGRPRGRRTSQPHNSSHVGRARSSQRRELSDGGGAARTRAWRASPETPAHRARTGRADREATTSSHRGS